MPKVINTYKNSNNLELIKEEGYYSNGAKEYQLTYYKGKENDTKRWDINGVKIDRLNDNPDSSIVFEVRTFQNRSYIISNGVK